MPLAVVALVLLAVAKAHNGSATVPNVVGDTKRSASVAIRAAGFVPAYLVAGAPCTLRVTGEAPRAGTRLRRGESVKMSVACRR
jgi:beta-lactam-binding protein with PASTA domain